MCLWCLVVGWMVGWQLVVVLGRFGLCLLDGWMVVCGLTIVILLVMSWSVDLSVVCFLFDLGDCVLVVCRRVVLLFV